MSATFAELIEAGAVKIDGDDAQYLLCHFAGKSASELKLCLNEVAYGQVEDVFFDAVKKRECGMPLQYICGVAPFRQLEVNVDSRVLIPRFETEMMVDIALNLANEQKQEQGGCIRVADICTGSGAIACAFKSEFDGECCVVAADISTDALEVAESNAKKYNLNIEFRKSDLMDAFVGEKFDLILSNPPYVPSCVYDGLLPVVKDFEPKVALVAGYDGLDIFRRLVAQAKDHLRGGGVFVCELFEESLDEARLLAKEAGFLNVSITKDLCGKPRFLQLMVSNF